MTHKDTFAYIICPSISISAKLIWGYLCPQAFFIDSFSKAKFTDQMREKTHIDTVTYLHLLYGEMPFNSSCTSVSLAAGATARQFIKVTNC